MPPRYEENGWMDCRISGERESPEEMTEVENCGRSKTSVRKKTGRNRDIFLKKLGR